MGEHQLLIYTVEHYQGVHILSICTKNIQTFTSQMILHFTSEWFYSLNFFYIIFLIFVSNDSNLIVEQ